MDEPTTMFSDNQAAMAMTQSYAVTRRNKHIEVRYHYTRRAVEDGVVVLEYCPTEDMTADMMTKALGRVKLQKFRKAAGLEKSESATTQ